MTQTCEFGDLRDSLIRDRIVCGIQDNNLRKRLLQERRLDLNTCIDKCRAAEVTEKRVKDMATKEVSALKYAHRKKTFPSEKKQSFGDKKQPHSFESNGRKCKFCCQVHQFKKGACPAWGKMCESCGKQNHFKCSNVCRKNVHGVQASYDSDSSSGESINAVHVIGAVNDLDKPIYCKMVVNKKPITLQIDPGATVNTITKRFVEGLPLQPSSTRLRMWNKSTLNHLETAS